MNLFSKQYIRSIQTQEFYKILNLIPKTYNYIFEFIRNTELGINAILSLKPIHFESHGIKFQGKRYSLEKIDQNILKEVMELVPKNQLKYPIFESHMFFSVKKRSLKRIFEKGKNRLKKLEEYENKTFPIKRPNFIVLGAPKCATTWLYDCLKIHPEVFLPSTKELEFFGTYNYYLGEKWYSEHFIDTKQEKICGDISVDYFHSAEAPEQIARFYQGNPPKLILMLREPISRVLSYYNYRVLYGTAGSSFEDAIKHRFFYNLFVDSGKYIHFYKNYLKYFPRENIKIILFDDIKKNSRNVLMDVFSFLEINENFYSSEFEKVSNKGLSIKNINRFCFTRNLGDLFYGCFPIPRWGIKIRNLLRTVNLKINTDSNSSYPKIKKETLEFLQQQYSDCNKQLAQEAEIDLSAWEYKKNDL